MVILPGHLLGTGGIEEHLLWKYFKQGQSEGLGARDMGLGRRQERKDVQKPFMSRMTQPEFYWTLTTRIRTFRVHV